LSTVSGPPAVSVCVANYNGGEVIGRCLESILAQETSATIEILVHDDASTDDSLALIRQRFPQVTLVCSEDNVGFCRANNRLAARARGDYLLLLNNDAWLEPDAVATLLLACTDGREAILTLPQFAAGSGELLDCGMFMDLFANPVPVMECRVQPVAMVMGACLWLPRRLWESCGGFPQWFGSIGEDMYLCNYARVLGHPVRALADSGYHHHVGYSFGGGKVVAGGLATTTRRRRLSERNKTFVMCLFYPWPALWVLLPAHLLALLAEGLVLALVKRDLSLFTRIYGHAVVEVFRQWPRWWGERRLIQRRRQIGLRDFFSVYRWLPYKLTMLLRFGVPRLD
jgi:GT2 family glycosyltransferase